MATGMSIALVLQTIRQRRPNPDAAKWVIFPRIDQKTCLKCIYTAGLKAKIVELRRVPARDAKSEQHLAQRQQQRFPLLLRGSA